MLTRSKSLKNVTLSSEKELRKWWHGSSGFKYEPTHNLIACHWYDNKSVQVVSNYAGKNPMGDCKKSCRREKKFISITRPIEIEYYNKHVGGVDLAYMQLEFYKNHRFK